MSRAEEAALKAYPYEGGTKGLLCDACRPIFIKGYEQAEKDLALTWEDARLIYIFTRQVMEDFDNDITLFNSTQEMYQEVLRRFNENRKK